MRNKKHALKYLPPFLPLLLGSTSPLFLHLLPLSSTRGQGIRAVVSSSLVSAAPSSPGGGLHTFPLFQCGVRYRGSFQHLLTEDTPVAPLLPKTLPQNANTKNHRMV